MHAAPIPKKIFMKSLLVIIFSTAMLVSCEKDFLSWDDVKTMEEDKYLYTSSAAFDVIAPSSVKYGDPIKIQVRSTGISGCSEFSHFTESYTGKNAINVKVIQKEPKEAICTTVLTTITSYYDFLPEARQQYTFNFWRGELHENDFITVKINVR